MNYVKEDILEFDYKEKRTSSKFINFIIILTIIFSVINCICIYDFYKLLCQL